MSKVHVSLGHDSNSSVTNQQQELQPQIKDIYEDSKRQYSHNTIKNTDVKFEIGNHFSLTYLGHGKELAERVKLDAFSANDIKKVRQ